MKISIGEIDRNSFYVNERVHPEGTFYLVIPIKTKHKWDPEEYHLRSILCNSEGEIVCSGFHKFKNFKEDPIEDEKTALGVSEGRAIFTEKLDGSLIIRSVINGNVYFRTRGSHNLGLFHDNVMSLISSKYPKLLDSNYMSNNVSMLFEYTSSDNKIVIDYKEPALTTLGYMQLFSDKLPKFCGSEDIIYNISKETNVNSPKFYNFDNSIDKVKGEVFSWKGKEGVVVWISMPNGEMHLSKIKAEEYIKIHSFKNHMNEDKLGKILFVKKITDKEMLKNFIFSLGFDWEAYTVVLPIFNRFIERKKKVDEIVSKIQKFSLNNKNLSEAKDIALALRNNFPGEKLTFNLGINYMKGNFNKVNKIIFSEIYNIPTAYVEKWKIESEEYYNSFNDRMDNA